MNKHFITIALFGFSALQLSAESADTASAAYKSGQRFGNAMIWIVLTALLVFALYFIRKSRKKD